MVTPLTSQGELDRGGVARLVSFLVDGGVHGLFVLGSTGEFVSLPWDRHKEVIKSTVSAVCGRIPVYAGVSSNCLEEVCQRAVAAAELGADVAVAVPPHYFHLSQSEVIQFFTSVADRSRSPW